MPNTVVVTGAHGFIGRHVARQFSAIGWNVVGMGHGSWSRDEWRHWGLSEWHVADIDIASLTAHAGCPQVIVHCAGSGSVGYSISHPHQDFLRTVATTAAVLEFMRLYSPGTRLVYPSSAGVYGAAERLPIIESQTLAPVSPYGVHKLMAEELCRSYARHFSTAVAVVRLFSVYGAGLRKQLLWDACSKVSRSENGFFGSGSETRDWLHVGDAASLLMAAAEHASPACPVVNGGCGQGASVREVLAELFAAFDRHDAPNFTGTARTGDPQDFVADIARANAWGWQPQVDWREGVREYAQWFRNGAL